MSTQDKYTAEQWAEVMAAPMVAGSLIMMSDMGITSVLGETKAMTEAMLKGDVPAGAKDLVASISAAVQGGQKVEIPSAPEGINKDPAQAKAWMMDQVNSAVAAVSANGDAAEVAGYKQYVYNVALAAAEAAKEGGFMGIGGKRVSEKEQAALDALKADLGI